MRRLVTGVGIVALVVLAGCGSTAESAAPAAPDNKYEFWGSSPDSLTFPANIGPIHLAPGQETTRCVNFRIGNAEPLLVTRIMGDLAPGSHHLILYRSALAKESLAPTECYPFRGITDGEAPLMIVERPHDELEFPKGVGLKLDTNAMIKVEAHYINTTSAPLEGTGKMTLEGLPLSKGGADLIESDLGFWGLNGIDVPPKSTWSTGQRFQRAIPGTKGFAVTTHQHRFGTRFQIWYSPTIGDTSAPPIADTTDWAEPPLYRLNPALEFDESGGLTYQCDWNNTSSTHAVFGESANDEMCFLWMYYYPSQGFDICFDGICLKRPAP